MKQTRIFVIVAGVMSFGSRSRGVSPRAQVQSGVASVYS
jgi:hypothetical protein